MTGSCYDMDIGVTRIWKRQTISDVKIVSKCIPLSPDSSYLPSLILLCYIFVDRNCAAATAQGVSEGRDLGRLIKSKKLKGDFYFPILSVVNVTFTSFYLCMLSFIYANSILILMAHTYTVPVLAY